MGLLDDVRRNKRAKEQTGPNSTDTTRVADFRAAAPAVDSVDDQAVTSPKMPLAGASRLTAMATREVDLTGAARKSLEVDSTPKSAAVAIVEKPVHPVAQPKVAPAPAVVTSEPKPEAPATSESKARTEEPAQVTVDALADAVVVKIKPYVDAFLGDLKSEVLGKLETISKTLEGHSKQLEERETAARAVADELEGTDNADGYVVEDDGEGHEVRNPSVRKHLAQLQESVDESLNVQRVLLGADYSSLSLFREAMQLLAEKQLLRALSVEDGAKRLKSLEKSIIEIGPPMAKMLLEKYAETHEIGGKQVHFNLIIRLANEKKLPIDATNVALLDDPKNAEIKRYVDETAPKFGKRAAECLENVNWARCERKNRELKIHRELISGGDK